MYLHLSSNCTKDKEEARAAASSLSLVTAHNHRRVYLVCAEWVLADYFKWHIRKCVLFESCDCMVDDIVYGLYCV